MSAKLLQINFSFDATPEEYTAAVSPLADDFAAVRGLHWKIWIINPEQREAGGVMLFEDQAAVGEFLDGPLAAAIKAHPAVRGLKAAVFDVMTAPTAITRGPVTTIVERTELSL